MRDTTIWHWHLRAVAKWEQIDGAEWQTDCYLMIMQDVSAPPADPGLRCVQLPALQQSQTTGTCRQTLLSLTAHA